MSVEIQFKLTSIGKTDIANLLAGETLEVKKVYITDAQSGEDEAYVSALSGNIVFQGNVHGEILYEKDDILYTKDEWDAEMPSGTIPDTGLLHVEFFDDSENYYGGKTIAITYTKELEERILCIATGESASDELVVKHFSPLSLSLDLRFESAENISFDSINLSFPPATEGRRGSVKLASSAEVMAGTGSGVVTSQNLNTRLGDYVTLDTTQTISGSKTFTSDIYFGNQNILIGGDGYYLQSKCIDSNLSSEIVQSFGNITFRLYNGSTAINPVSIGGVSNNTESRVLINADYTVFPEGKKLSFEKYNGYYLNLYETTHQGLDGGQSIDIPDLKVDMSGLSVSDQSRFIISSDFSDVAYFDTHGLTILANKSINFGNTSTYNLSVESVTDTYTSILNNTIQIGGKSLVLYNDFTDETIYTVTTTASASFYPQYSFYINDSFYGIPASIRAGSFSLKGKYKFTTTDEQTQATTVINAYFSMTDISPTTVSTGALQLCAAKNTDSSHTDLEDGDTVIADPKLVLKYSDYNGVPTLEVDTALADYGNVLANNFIGNLKGNADTATTAETATLANTAKGITYVPSSGTSTQLLSATSSYKILPTGTSETVYLGDSDHKFGVIYANSFNGHLSGTADAAYLIHLPLIERPVAGGSIVDASTQTLSFVPYKVGDYSSQKVYLGDTTYKWDKLYCNYIGDDDNKVTTVYATNVGNSSNHVSTSYINNLYVGSSGDSLSSYIRNELATAISTTSSIGAIRLFCIEFSPDQTVANYIEAGTTFTSSGVTDSGNLTHTPKFATFASSTLIIDSNVNLSIMRCFDHTGTIYGTWKVLTRVYVYNRGSYANCIPFLAVRIA